MHQHTLTARLGGQGRRIKMSNYVAVLDGTITGTGHTESDAAQEAKKFGGHDAIYPCTDALTQNVQNGTPTHEITHGLAHTPAEIPQSGMLDEAQDEILAHLIGLLVSGNPEVRITKNGSIAFLCDGVWISMAATEWALYARPFLLERDPSYARVTAMREESALRHAELSKSAPRRAAEARVAAARRELAEAERVLALLCE